MATFEIDLDAAENIAIGVLEMWRDKAREAAGDPFSDADLNHQVRLAAAIDVVLAYVDQAPSNG